MEQGVALLLMQKRGETPRAAPVSILAQTGAVPVF